MTCVILAGGRGVRLSPITDTIPKPLIEVRGKAIIDYLLEIVVELFDEIIIIVEYRAEQLRSHILGLSTKRKISFIQQNPKFRGTMGALLSASDYLYGNFLVVCADNFYTKKDIKNLTLERNSILIKSVSVKEKDSKYRDAKYSLLDSSDRVYLEAGAWFLDRTFLNLPPVKVPRSNEYGIPHSLYRDYINHPQKYNLVFAEYWYPMGTPWELDYIIKHVKDFPF